MFIGVPQNVLGRRLVVRPDVLQSARIRSITRRDSRSVVISIKPNFESILSNVSSIYLVGFDWIGVCAWKKFRLFRMSLFDWIRVDFEAGSELIPPIAGSI